jgi:FAD-dependent urate hydroxylase
VELTNGGGLVVDHVLLGTGYRVDVARYPFLARELLTAVQRVGGYPVLRPGLESSVPGLHLVGAPAAWSFGPIMRFVSGSWYASQSVTRAARGTRVDGLAGAHASAESAV